MLRVFVYGTLKPGYVNYAAYCDGYVVEQVQARVRGKLFALPLGYPCMTQGDTWVEGYLLILRDNELLSALDGLEDYSPHRTNADNMYLRQETEVFDSQGKPLGVAWAYFMTPHKVEQLNGCWLPKGVWP